MLKVLPHEILVVGFWTLETRKLHEEDPGGSSEGDEANIISSNDSRVGRVDAVSTADPTFGWSFCIHQLSRHGNVHFACAVSVTWRLTLPRGEVSLVPQKFACRIQYKRNHLTDPAPYIQDELRDLERLIFEIRNH